MPVVKLRNYLAKKKRNQKEFFVFLMPTQQQSKIKVAFFVNFPDLAITSRNDLLFSKQLFVASPYLPLHGCDLLLISMIRIIITIMIILGC